MAPRLQSGALLVLVVLIIICSLHADHVAAAKCASGKKNCDKNMRCNNGRNGLRKCRSYPNAIPTCKNGCCSAKCKPVYANCNRDMTRDGCETFIAGEDASNCGGCGKQCQVNQYPNAVTLCRGGKCGILQCYRGSTDCNGKLEDGCEEYTDSDVNSCGACYHKCPVYPNSVPGCYYGICRYTCKDGFTYCTFTGEVDERGCFDEGNLLSDANNCGRCFNKCDVGQSCQQGSCMNIPS